MQQVLEVIDKGAASDQHRTPLLFVHGAFHGAWCWDEHFLDFFAARGYRALALNLRGHAASPSPTPLNECTSPTTSTMCTRSRPGCRRRRS